MKKITFLAKTDLNLDGRILNQLKILKELDSTCIIDFILFADKKLNIHFEENVKIHEVKTLFRHNKILRFLTVLDFTLKTLHLLFKIKPNIVHAEDTSIIFPTYIYKMLKGKKVKLIYDDHELPNENENFSQKIFVYLETQLMKHSDFIIFANNERLQYIKEKYRLTNRMSYFLNLPYYEDDDRLELPKEYTQILSQIDNLKEREIKFIIHQGVLEVERGRKKLAEFSKILPNNYKILLLGGSRRDFEQFLLENQLSQNSFFFVGTVNYWALPYFWKRGLASIVMYLPTLINNRLCAPNRFYLSVDKGLPVIVNKDNPVLKNFIESLNCGYFIEDFIRPTDVNKVQLFDSNSIRNSFSELKQFEKANFKKIYQTI